jgi:hypothetical protein
MGMTWPNHIALNGVQKVLAQPLISYTHYCKNTVA